MNKKSYGFTLIEVLVAMIITVAAGILVANSWSGNFLRMRKLTLNNNITSLLERKIVEMEAKYQGKKTTDIKEEEGDFGEEFPQYRWTFTVQPFEMPDMTPLLTAGSDSVDETYLMVLNKMREVMSKAILEGTVTVFVKTGEKENSFSVTTYFVDYETEIPFGP